jgi:hypothetical protein
MTFIGSPSNHTLLDVAVRNPDQLGIHTVSLSLSLWVGAWLVGLITSVDFPTFGRDRVEDCTSRVQGSGCRVEGVW